MDQYYETIVQKTLTMQMELSQHTTQSIYDIPDPTQLTK